MIIFLITSLIIFFINNVRSSSSSSSTKCYSYNSIDNPSVFNNTCYIAYNIKLDFDESITYCKTNFHKRSNLVKILHNKVNDFLNELRVSKTQSYWIGLKYLNFTDWFWIKDFSKLGFQKWSSSEPSWDGVCVEMWDNENGEWNDAPCISKRSFFCSYDLYFCNNIISNDNNVCSGNGICNDTNKCECNDECNYGERCEYFYCENKKWNETGVCNNRGNCSSCNDCNCFEKYYYGNDCDEKIMNGTFYKNERRIMIPYNVQSKFIRNSIFFGDFDCSLILNSTLNPSYCKFILNKNYTDSLNIYLKSIKFDIKEVFIIKPITSPKKTVNIMILKVINPIFINDETILIIILITIILIFLFAVFIFIILITVFVVFGNILKKNKKRQKRLTDDLDVISIIDKNESKALPIIDFNKKLFTIDFDSLDIKKSIGQGSFATVYSGEWNGIKIAFKCFNTKNICSLEHDFSEFETEVSLSTALSHPNILRFYGCTIKPPRVGIVMEYCEMGDLKNYLIKNKVEYKDKLELLKQVCLGMIYVHGQSVLHRDLKLENILITKNIKVKICDFGIGKWMSDYDSKKENTSRKGTSIYMAPEVTLGKEYDGKCDVFSFGIIMYIVISENFDPYGKNKFNIEIKVANDPKYRPDASLIESMNLRFLIKNCWDNVPEERPDFKKINKKIDLL